MHNTVTTMIQPTYQLFGKTHSRFRTLLETGIILGMIAGLILAVLTGLSALVVLGLIASLTLAAYGLGVAVKLIAGAERHTFYHTLIALLVAAILYLRAVKEPVLPYLDLVLVALAVPQAVGRLVCLMAGCCHGRPARWGVRYPAAYAARHGFPRHLVNVPLVPTQLIESGWALITFTGGSALLLAGSPPGTALVLALSTYAAQRFALEFLRGDAARPYPARFGGTLSEAQITALVLVTLLALASAGGLTPLPVPVIALAGVLWAAAAITIRRAPHTRLIAPPHIREIAQSAARSAAAHDLAPVTTSLGLRLTARLATNGTNTHGAGTHSAHYALSRSPHPLNAHDAHRIARLLVTLRHAGAPFTLTAGRFGVFHVLVRPEGSRRDV